MQNKAAKYSLRARRKAGELLKKIELHKGIQMKGSIVENDVRVSAVEQDDSRVKLKDLGITRTQSSNWKQIPKWGKYEHGKYDDAVKMGYEKRAVEDYEYTSDNVKSTVRTVNLSWAHHRLVAPIAVTMAKEKYNKSFTELTEEEQKPIIEEQKEWLQQAVDNDWSVRD